MYLKKVTLLLLVSALLCLIISCSDNDNITGSKSIFTMDQFPMELGCQWTYSIHDTLADTYDTVTIAVIDTTTIFGEPATIWVSVDRSYIPGVQFVAVVGDSVKIYCDRCAVPARLLVFPLAEGNTWDYESDIGDVNCQVLNDTTVNVTAGDFTSVHVYQEYQGIAMDVIDYSDTWLVPDVGIVRFKHVSGWLAPSSVEIWELLAYSAPD